ncbi:hypothetical protein EWU23_03405 [Cytophagaceae bacterium 50C-KIRBA]|uniref:Alpha-L-rhamnosidase six-hairpin glycosidase domain-containing protein n=1 Tax=Aquirufa beregesia TaxID=2516556 RepID=A0ABX0F106_9BACT|nr:hypothetical protein [Aquirufa beregesia]NGZ43515.1 hypothetical protein [Aquirufa beregesia]
MRLFLLLIFWPFIQINAQSLISQDDWQFLKELTQAVIDSSRIRPHQRISPDFGPNQTGGTLIRPGARTSYPAFWIRDYAMSVGTGMITIKEQKHMLCLTAATQNEQIKKTKYGSTIPKGAIADHIRIDDAKPIYFPGTYSFENQGEIQWGYQPPLDDMFFFIHMAYEYVKQSEDLAILDQKIHGISLFNRLILALESVPINPKNQLVSVTDSNRGVDFGFRDAIHMTGDLCFPSLLRYQALCQLAELYQWRGNEEECRRQKAKAAILKQNIVNVFLEPNGMLKASTGKSAQVDVWSTAWAVYTRVLAGEDALKASRRLSQAYQNNTLAYRGAVRHVLKSDDFSEFTAWEGSLVKKESYQNGAYWSTATGWVAYTLTLTHFSLGQQLIQELIKDLRKGDFRKGKGFGAPWECFTESYQQNPVYMTSVSVPYQVIQQWTNK